MYYIAVFLSCAFMAFATWHLCRRIENGDKTPPLATFMIHSSMFCISFWMYMHKVDGWSLTANIALAVSALSAIAITLWIFRNYNKSPGMRMIWSDCTSVAATIAILIYWKVSNNQEWSYMALQIAAVVGYLPTWQRVIWDEDKNSQSSLFWSAVFMSIMVAAFTAWVQADFQAKFYIFRGGSCALLTVILIEWRKRFSK